ncbi:MarR family transcriptional regulator [Tissierella creatinini]|nr:MarR family transcriptional regulator [Tissierella creatinini]TJX65274.1 MarR family transcriptional regulator [Soehngenia saccharolytica]
MENQNLLYELIGSLEKIYYLEGFTQLMEFLQGEMYILHYMSQNLEEEINPSTLSEKLHLTRPRVTAILNTLKKKAYVETKQDEEDRRRLTVRITEKGLSLINEKQSNAKEYFHLFIDSVGEENVKDLIRIIDLAAKEIDNKKGSRG